MLLRNKDVYNNHFVRNCARFAGNVLKREPLAKAYKLLFPETWPKHRLGRSDSFSVWQWR